LAYQQASDAVEAVISTIGVNNQGEPLSDVFVVSDHGMAPFHSAVNLGNLLRAAGIDTTGLGLRTTGPAAHIYVNLAGREPGGTVSSSAYTGLVAAIAAALGNVVDPHAFFNPGQRPLFSNVWSRPSICGAPGFCTDEFIGRDSGDVVALMVEGYNFDGTQAPVVPRLGEPAPSSSTVFSVPNFYGAHGHDSELPSMSAILYAAGPSLKHKKVDVMKGIDIAPTILRILEVPGAPTIDGTAIPKILKKDKD
jgi:predicted AlkP superfamily pyrophosphatase or phosphodiesterase